MKGLPQISIIIPVYNVEQYITECMQSVMCQTYAGEIECILVDDCGTDNSMTIAEQLIADYKGTIVFRILHHERNRGLSAARNTGTQVASGEYVYYLDSDDYISDDCIETIAAPLQIKKYDVVVGEYRVFGDSHESSWLKEKRHEIIGNEAIFESYIDWKLYVMAWNKLCRTSFLRENRIEFVEGQLHEDVLWTYKMMLSIQSIAIVHTVGYNYRIRANSIKTDNSKIHKKISAYADTIEYIQTHSYPVNSLYLKCLFFYWNLYLSIALSSRLSFANSYVRLRKTCPYNPILQLVTGKASIRQLNNMHLALPSLLGYSYLRLRYCIKAK